MAKVPTRYKQTLDAWCRSEEAAAAGKVADAACEHVSTEQAAAAAAAKAEEDAQEAVQAEAAAAAAVKAEEDAQKAFAAAVAAATAAVTQEKQQANLTADRNAIFQYRHSHDLPIMCCMPWHDTFLHEKS